MEPYVVQSVTDASGNIVKYHEPTQVRQVISQQTSDLVRSMMESVVGDGGTGKNAFVNGYRIGGKTGTSQTRQEGHLITSFVVLPLRMIPRSLCCWPMTTPNRLPLVLP